jgi:hypothetical protein
MCCALVDAVVVGGGVVTQTAVVGAIGQWLADLPVHPTSDPLPEFSARSVPAALVPSLQQFVRTVGGWSLTLADTLDRMLVADFQLPWDDAAAHGKATLLCSCMRVVCVVGVAIVVYGYPCLRTSRMC